MRNKAKFYLYRNLHTGGFSVKHKGIVCDRGDIFVMDNVEFRVSEPGSARVKKEKKRNVHAYMVAESYIRLEEVSENHKLEDMTQVTYFPKQDTTFVNAETGDPVLNAKYAIAVSGRVFIKESL